MWRKTITLQRLHIPISPHLKFLLFFFLLINNQIQTLKAYTFIYAGCSQEKFQPNTPFESNRNSLLSSIVTASSQSLYNSFALGNDTAAPVYGLYQCRGDLQVKDCSTCISAVVSQITLMCPYTNGANLQLDTCFVEYDRSNFLGNPDTGLRYKKCSTSVNNDGDFLRRRDDVLAALGGAMGFRVSSSGYVEGYAQCLGDLSGPDCSGCLSEAVMKVKSFCGSAAAGDVFLAQCYVRYWASGYYDNRSGSSRDDDAGKTVAIILGVIAGVAVVIVVLSLLRRSPS